MANLREHIRHLPSGRRGEIADAAGIGTEYLRQIAYGHCNASIEVAIKLAAATGVDGADSLVSKSNKKLLAHLRGAA
jgi:transcriptional regulator with XRE-family HTH domain